MHKYSVNNVINLQSFRDPNDKIIHLHFYSSGHWETIVQFPPTALSGSSNMSLESVAVLVS